MAGRFAFKAANKRFLDLNSLVVTGVCVVYVSQGWWNKIVLFAPASGLRGRVLYIDLDTVVTASLMPVLSYKVCGQ